MLSLLSTLAVSLAVQGEANQVAATFGLVEMKARGADAWVPLHKGSSVPTGALIRTGKSRCALNLRDGAQLFVDHSTQVRVTGDRSAEVIKGRAGVHGVKESASYELVCGSARVKTGVAIPPADATVTIALDAAKKIVRIIQVSGMSTASSGRGKGKQEQMMTRGYWCEVNRGTLNTPDPAGDTTVVTAWTHELLAARDSNKKELRRRMDGMLQQLGLIPKDDPYEKAFRDSGDATISHVSTFLKRPFGPRDAERRQRAAKLMGTMAGKGNEVELIDCLKDPDANVRVEGAKGLLRVTGLDLGFSEAYWGGDSPDKGITAWDAWLKTNKPTSP